MSGLQNGSDPARADYDWRQFAAAIRRMRAPDPRGLRAIGDDIGITVSDLSRAMGGQIVSVGKVIAICRWLGVAPDHFYLEPDFSLKSTCFTGNNVKQDERATGRGPEGGAGG